MWKLVTGTSLAFAIFAAATADDTAEKPEVTVEKPHVIVEFCGRLRHGVMVIGGECTGTTIAVNRITWEIQLSNEAQQQLAQQHHKKTMVVTGNLKKVVGIEMKDRWIIDAKKLVPQDPAKNKPGVRMAIAGKLRPVNSEDTPSSLMTIDSGGQIWPIDLSADEKLKTTARSLIDERIWLMGSLKQPAEQDSNQKKSGLNPILQVSSIKQAVSQSPKQDDRQ